jgi:hypothetical protein
MRLLEKTEGVASVLGPEDFVKRGLPRPDDNPRQADIMVSAAGGYAFGGELRGDVLTKTQGLRGAHGHLPDQPRMGALFVAWGAGIRAGVKLERVRAIDIAPTAARILGIDLPTADGRVLEEILE